MFNLTINSTKDRRKTPNMICRFFYLAIIIAASPLLADEDYKRKFVDVHTYMTEQNLKFDAITHPTGIFTSADTDTSTYSDAVARQQLVEIGNSNKQSRLSYLEAGDVNGDPIILIHGAPTQGYMWRKVMPLLPQDAHIIAIDLIGFGWSSKPQIQYTFKQQSAYLEAFIATLGLDAKPITFVMHDFSSVQGLSYASRFPQNIKGVAFFESLLGPVPSFDVMPPEAQFIRTPEGNDTIVFGNYYLEHVLVSPDTSNATLSEEDLEIYHKPFLKVEDRQPLASIPLEVPIMGGAPDGHGDTNIASLGRNAQYLMTNPVPRLFMYGDPGFLIGNQAAAQIIAGFNPQGSMTAVNVGAAKHYFPEEIPAVMANEISAWYQGL